MDAPLGSLLNQFTAWKGSFDTKRLQVYMYKTKIVIHNPLAEHQVDPSKCPCSVCKQGVGNNSTITVEVRSIIIVQT